MARYVITGGTGFLGSALVNRLRSQGEYAIVAGRRRNQLGQADDFIEYDLQDTSTISNIISASPDGIFHLAWSTTPAFAERDVYTDVHNNLSGTVALFEKLKGELDTPIVFVSSGGTIYGQSEVSLIDEDQVPKPIGFYGQTKAAAEGYARIFCMQGSSDIRIARVSNPYGPSQSSARLQGAATFFARQILSGNQVIVWGDGSIIRDYIHSRDVADGLIGIMNIKRQRLDKSPIYNIGSGVGTTLNDLISIIARVCGREAMIRYAPGRSFDVHSNVLDISKIFRDTGWRPRYDLNDGLHHLVESLARSEYFP